MFQHDAVDGAFTLHTWFAAALGPPCRKDEDAKSVFKLSY